MLKIIHSANDQNQNSSITAIDISYDEELIIAGFASSQIELFDALLGSSLKIFKNIHLTPILCLKFYHDNTKSLKFSRVISSDNGSKIFRLCFEKGIFSYDCEKQLIMEKNCGQVCQIELLHSANLKNSEKTRDHKIFGFASLIRVSIIQMEPKITKIFTINRPDLIKEKNPPSISWTEGLFQTNSYESSILMMISWGNQYFLINLRHEDKNDDIVFHAQMIAHLQINFESIYSSFLSSRILISFLDNNKGILINLEDFEEVNESLSNQIVEENLNEILKKMDHSIFQNYLEFEYNEKIVFNSYIKDSYNMARSCYLQSFSPYFNFNKIFFIEDEDISQLNLFTWKNYINAMINNGDRFSALNSIIKVYKGEEKYVAGISEIKEQRFEIMKEYSEIMAQDYLILNLQKIDIKEQDYEKKIRDLMLTIIEFLIETDNSDFLFNNIKQIFIKAEMEEKFIENLEPFILKCKIKLFYYILFLLKIYIRYIPESVLQNIVNYFKKKKKMDLIQRLIVSLDLKKIDSFPLVNLCLELHFFKALIYICTIYDQDFMTPLIKIFNLYILTKKTDESEAKDYGLR